MPSASARVLLRNFDSDVRNLRFSDFSIEYLHQANRRGLERAQQFIPESLFGESMLERNYADIPFMEEAWSGFGAIPSQVEDLLLCLRLYRPGDLAFVSLSIQKADSQPCKQYPYRVISNLVNVSTRPFAFNQADIKPWEEF